MGTRLQRLGTVARGGVVALGCACGSPPADMQFVSSLAAALTCQGEQPLPEVAADLTIEGHATCPLDVHSDGTITGTCDDILSGTVASLALVYATAPEETRPLALAIHFGVVDLRRPPPEVQVQLSADDLVYEQ